MNKSLRRYAGEDDDSDDEQPNLFYRQASSKLLNKSNQEFLQAAATEQQAHHSSTPKIDFCLPYLQATLFACILEDAITQLRILDECNNELRIIKTLADLANLRAKKYQITHGKAEDELSGIDCRKLGCMQYKLDKLHADRIYCNEVLVGTYLELSLTRCYSTVMDSSRDIEDRESYREVLADEEARNKALRRDLMRQLRQQRNHMKTVAYDTDLIVDKLKSKVEDAALNSKIRSRYIANWQCSRSEQHQQEISDKEAGPSNSINFYRLRSDQEQRIHAEVELLVNIFINDTLQKVETWMNKYDADMEAIDLKIQIMKNMYQGAVEKRQELEETLAHHEVLMKNWKQFKEERVKALAYKELMTKSAIIVQAWWRGLLVRLELGPYKPPRRRPPLPGEVVQKKKK